MKKYIIIISMVLVCASAWAKTYVVIAGIADYPGNDMDLLFEDNDAQAIRGLFRSVGDASLITLADSNATKKRILSSLRQQFRKAQEDDAILFYFSGHGYSGGFCPYDYRINNYSGALPYEEVINIMKHCKARRRMLFADACYSGKARYTPKQTDKKYKQNIMFFLSSRTNETSAQVTSMKNSCFTAYLVDGLRGDADANADKRVTARELYDYVHGRVIDRMEPFEFKQHPVMWGNFDDNMVVIDWNRKSKK